VTVDQCYLRLDRAMGSNLAYVGMTRHKQNLQIYLDRETFKDKKDIINCLGITTHKGLVKDYAPHTEAPVEAQRVRQYQQAIGEAGAWKRKGQCLV
jgi:superfamily I DNA/RNA helicase